MSRTTSTLAAAGAVVLAAGAVVAAADAAAPHHSALRFSHEVVVDQQRSGFEPDIAIDNADRWYSSVPNGSSTAHSFIWQSLDHGKSFQLIPGQIGVGKPLTCFQGGGDTELQLDKKGTLFFSDLQNLTNLSNSVSTDHGATFTTSCASVPNTPVDRMWYAIHGNYGDPDFAIYEEYDAADSGLDPSYGDPVTGRNPTNQLVEAVSHDGRTFTPVFNQRLAQGHLDDNCIGGGQLNCVTDDEGISGNQLIAHNGDLLIAHTSADGNQVVVSRGKLTQLPGGQVAATWKHMVVNASLCPDKANAAPGICGATNFATIAEDSAGHFYVGFSSQRINKNGKAVGPYQTYVVASRDGFHWNKPSLVSQSGSNAFSWVTAGSNGRAAVAWYHANEAQEHGSYVLDDLAHAEISVQVGESLDALSAHPHWDVATVSEHPIKYGPLCTQGLLCTVSMGDRSLGDFLEVNHDAQGALVLSYVDDTSNTYTTGPTGAIAENGPVVMVKQTGGPSLVKGTIRGPGHGPGAPWGSVRDSRGDAFYNANAERTPAGANLDLTGASIREDAKGLVVTMRAKDLSNLQVAPTAGGTTGEWITRFTTYNPHTAGNGHIYYAGMESVAGSSPRFFVGDTAAVPVGQEQISMLFDSNTSVPGTVQGNTITIHVPYADLPAAKPGATLYSATAFTATTVGTLAGNPAGVFNLTDATPPFDYAMHGSRRASALPATVAPLLAWGAWLGIVERRRRRS
ncbi:MAG TPA: hypothetical protein VFT62_10680 [Mycobacteriales bacterium]|nr:hypothetical protein [Mycobacteriales bacterium]